jgi:hypothetical protein
MHSVKLAGQVMSAEVRRQGRKQQDKSEATAEVRREGKKTCVLVTRIVTISVPVQVVGAQVICDGQEMKQ